MHLQTAMGQSEVAYIKRRVSSANVIAFGQRLAGRIGQAAGQATSGGSSGAGRRSQPGGRGRQPG